MRRNSLNQNELDRQNRLQQLNEYPDILDPQDLRKILRVGRAAVYKLLAEGTIPSFKIGRTYRIPKTALTAYLNKCTDAQKGGER